MDFDHARQLLLSRRDELVLLSTQTADARRPVALDQQSVGRLSRMDALQGQAMAKASEERRQVEIARIGAALGRIDDESYGECLRCGQAIEDRRLAFDPAATLCAACARGG